MNRTLEKIWLCFRWWVVPFVLGFIMVAGVIKIAEWCLL